MTNDKERKQYPFDFQRREGTVGVSSRGAVEKSSGSFAAER